MLEPIFVEDYCSAEKAHELAQRVLNAPRVRESLSKNETVFLLGAELQSSSPGKSLPEVEEFHRDFEELRIWLEKRFSAKVEYHPMLPPPGFHMHFKTAAFGGKVHADGQAYSASTYLKTKFLSAWSVVLSLNSPKKGGGVHFWKLSPSELAHKWGNLEGPPPEPSFTLRLEAGKILIFKSETIHQIQGFEIEDLKDARITLIAHLGETEPGRFVLYWDRIGNVKNYLGLELKPERMVLDRFSGKLFPTDE